MITARKIALVSIALLVTSAALASSTESYRGLYLWAARHGLPGTWAALFPLQVDVFIVVGELALFVALASQWDKRSRTGAWLVTIAGLAVSTMGNVGHAASAGLASRATAAVPPLAAAAALAVGLGVLKRVARQAAPEDAGAVERGAPALPAVPAPDPAVTPEVTSRSPALEAAPEATPGAAAGALHAVPEVTGERPRERPSGARGKQPGPATPERLREHYAAELAAGRVPSIRQIKREWPVGYDRATELHDQLTAVTETAS